ncbi:MAG: hypothetical protein WC365_01775 [Candidatus Babeliales bacterium]|jgi:hypothetical protein
MKNLRTIALVALMTVGYSNCSAMQLPFVEQLEQLDTQTPSNPDVQQLRDRQSDSKKEIRKQQPICGNTSPSKFSMKKLLIAMVLSFFLFFTPAINLKPVQSEHVMQTVDTTTTAHMNMYCKFLPDQDCQLCCNQKPCKQTYNATACQIYRVFLPRAVGNCIFQGCTDTYGNQPTYSFNTLTTAFRRSSLHSKHVELWHAYKGHYGVIFDVITEIAQRLYGDPHNQSPLFLRILTENFKDGGKNVTHFLKTTWPLYQTDGEPNVQALILSTNVALTGNMQDQEENTLNYFIKGPSSSFEKPDPKKYLAHIFRKFMLSRTELIKEIETIYSHIPNTRHLLQIFVPREIANMVAYLSAGWGVPYEERDPLEQLKNLTTNIVEALNVIAKLSALDDASPDNFEKIDKIQARLLLNPRYAKHFIVYRYFTTPEDEKAWQEARSKVHSLFDKEFTQLGKETVDTLSLRERILMEEDGAREEGLRKLAELPKDSPLGEELRKVLEESPEKDQTK